MLAGILVATFFTAIVLGVAMLLGGVMTEVWWVEAVGKWTLILLSVAMVIGVLVALWYAALVSA